MGAGKVYAAGRAAAEGLKSRSPKKRAAARKEVNRRGQQVVGYRDTQRARRQERIEREALENGARRPPKKKAARKATSRRKR